MESPLVAAAPLFSQRSPLGDRCCRAGDSSALLAPASSSSSSSVLSSCGPSLQPLCRPSSLLRPLLTSRRLSPRRSPQVRCRICPLVPPGSTQCVLMIFGLRCSGPACRPHPASLPVRVPAVESLPSASFSFALRFGYGYRHRSRLAPFIQLDSAHAGHTMRRPRRPPCTLSAARDVPGTFPLLRSPGEVRLNREPRWPARTH
jgi:hypothetical protein